MFSWTGGDRNFTLFLNLYISFYSSALMNRQASRPLLFCLRDFYLRALLVILHLYSPFNSAALMKRWISGRSFLFVSPFLRTYLPYRCSRLGGRFRRYPPPFVLCLQHLSAPPPPLDGLLLVCQFPSGLFPVCEVWVNNNVLCLLMSANPCMELERKLWIAKMKN